MTSQAVLFFAKINGVKKRPTCSTIYAGVNFQFKDEYLLKLLANTNQSVSVYIFKVYVLVLCINVPAVFLLDFILPNADEPNFEVSIVSFIGAVFLSPIFETLLMIPIISLFKKMTINIIYVSIMSAFIWGALHWIINTPISGVAALLGFFLMSMIYQNWDVHSRKYALFIVLIIHILNNASIFTWFALES